jgi:rare lipoprotein A
MRGDLTMCLSGAKLGLAVALVSIVAAACPAVAQNPPSISGFQNRFAVEPATPIFTRPENRLGVLPRTGGPAVGPEPSLLDPTPVGSLDDPSSAIRWDAPDGAPKLEGAEASSGRENAEREPANRPSESAMPQVPSERPIGRGLAAWYEHPGRTANGERYRPDGLTAAHRTLPFGTRVRITHQRNGRSVVVRINDRAAGPRRFAIDLSRGAARRLGIEGVAPVTMSLVSAPTDTPAPVAQMAR